MNGKRILVVEDEFLIALDITQALEAAGHTVIGPAGNSREALKFIASEHFDGALLDANLAGQPVGEIADALSDRQIPFAFVSGYGKEHLPQAHRGAALVRKPFSGEELVCAISGFGSHI